MIKKLRRKIVCITMVVVTVMLFVAFAFVYEITQETLRHGSTAVIKHHEGEDFDRKPPDGKKSPVLIPFFHLTVNEDGSFTPLENKYEDNLDMDFFQEVGTLALAQGKNEGTLKEYDLRFTIEQGKNGPEIFFSDISGSNHVLNSILVSSIFIGILCLCVFFVISIFFARWATKPVEKAWEQQRQFVADASHELKTPLTVILTNAELLCDPQCAQESRLQLSGNILTMSRKMKTLVEELLRLARVDNEAGEMAMKPLDYSSIVSEALLPFEPLFFEHTLTLKSDIQPDICVKGSGPHLTQAVQVLLDNALKYSFDDSAVEVTLKQESGYCFLRVSNQGNALSTSDQQNIFKRFYRCDRVRSLSGSYGLGLPIALGIVQAHKGKISVSSCNGTNVFTIKLPVV